MNLKFTRDPFLRDKMAGTWSYISTPHTLLYNKTRAHVCLLSLSRTETWGLPFYFFVLVEDGNNEGKWEVLWFSPY
jgi:hypothetical protein